MTTLSTSTEPACKSIAAAAPKWAAIVGDALFPMPRRSLKARDILAQAGITRGILVRDYNQPLDLPIPVEADVDLADGNVFRIAEECEEPHCQAPAGAAPKLAFVADDAWEITVQPTQTLESLRGLLGLPEGAQVFRDFESPGDKEIELGTPIRFEDGPVFRTRITSLTVTVNRKPVRFAQRRVTGLEIKQAAISQNIAIELGFVLHRKLPNGEYGPPIRDDQAVVLRDCDEFRCVAPDDNS